MRLDLQMILCVVPFVSGTTVPRNVYKKDDLKPQSPVYIEGFANL